MLFDPSEPYRESRRAVEAKALAAMAEASARAAMENSHGDSVSCAGCKAAEQGGDWGQENCREMRREGICQRQVYVRVTMARLLVELVRVLGEVGTSETLIREVVQGSYWSQLPEGVEE